MREPCEYPRGVRYPREAVGELRDRPVVDIFGWFCRAAGCDGAHAVERVSRRAKLGSTVHKVLHVAELEHHELESVCFRGLFRDSRVAVTSTARSDTAWRFDNDRFPRQRSQERRMRQAWWRGGGASSSPESS